MSSERIPTFITALTNELRMLGATVFFTAEIDAYVDDNLQTPIAPASATMDNGILLRHVELSSELRRVVSVLKARQSETDPATRAS